MLLLGLLSFVRVRHAHAWAAVLCEREACSCCGMQDAAEDSQEDAGAPGLAQPEAIPSLQVCSSLHVPPPASRSADSRDDSSRFLDRMAPALTRSRTTYDGRCLRTQLLTYDA